VFNAGEKSVSMSDTTPADILRAARALIDAPEKWTQDAYRRDAEGNKCKPAAAVCWCAEGAILAASDDSVLMMNRWRAEDLLTAAAPGAIAIFNDAPGRTHAEVLAAFDRAIELAETAR
jgi:hypothetical protein